MPPPILKAKKGDVSLVRYVIKRVLLMPVILLLVCLILFYLISLSKVDPALQLLGANYSQEQYDNLREELGLDDPIIVQYGRYILNACKGDLGSSYYYKTDVTYELSYRWHVSLRLAVIVAALATTLGMLLGILCATHQYSWIDRTLNMVAKCFGAIPNFLFNLVIMMIFCLKLELFPSYGVSSWKGWICPIIAMVLASSGDYMRYTRSSMLDCIRQDYIRTARAKGCTEGAVVYKHALKNALLPLVTKSGIHIANIMGSAVVVENVFTIPGLGTMITTAIKQRDVPMIMGGCLFLAAFFLIITLIIDLLYAAIDPRVKATFIKKAGPRPRRKSLTEGGADHGTN